MKPFNLQDALAGKPVVTRDGKAVKQIAYFPEVETYAVMAYIEGSDVDTYTREGSYWSSKGTHDLFMASTKKTGWVNIYRENITGGKMLRLSADGTTGHNIHPSKYVADVKQVTAKDRIAVVELTWEE
jgi:hypothetical protein